MKSTDPVIGAKLNSKTHIQNMFSDFLVVSAVLGYALFDTHICQIVFAYNFLLGLSTF